MGVPVVVALGAGVWLLRSMPHAVPVGVPVTGLTGLLLGAFALAGAETAVWLARRVRPSRFWWRQLFAVAVGASTLLLIVPVVVWVGLFSDRLPAAMPPYLAAIAALAYLCGVVICPPLHAATVDADAD